MTTVPMCVPAPERREGQRWVVGAMASGVGGPARSGVPTPVSCRGRRQVGGRWNVLVWGDSRGLLRPTGITPAAAPKRPGKGLRVPDVDPAQSEGHAHALSPRLQLFCRWKTISSKWPCKTINKSTRRYEMLCF